MTHEQFIDWRCNVAEVMGLNKAESGFLAAWEDSISAFSFEDALAGLKSAITDPRWAAIKIRADRLSLVLEHMANVRTERSRQQSRKSWGPCPALREAWNRKMLATGAIDHEEFERRQKGAQA